MGGWRNWSGAVRATPRVLHRPRTVEDVCAAVTRARAGAEVLRVAGSGHSFTPIAASDQHMLTMTDLPGAVDISGGEAGASVTVGAGVTIRELNLRLTEHDLALANMGDIDHQVVAGALATGTHGTGAAFGPMHTAVDGIELVDGTGALRWVDQADLPAARLAVGSLGVVTRLRLSVVPAYRLATTVTRVPLDDVLADFAHHIADHRHAEFYWLPHTRWCQLKLADATDEPPLPAGLAQRVNDVVLENVAVWTAGQVARTFPGASAAVSRILAAGVSDVSARRPSHQAFASVRWVRFQEMEYALPRAALPAVLDALEDLITRDRLPVALPVEVRAVAADTSAWLSPAWERDSAYVAIHAFRGMPYTRYFKAAEEIFRSHDGRPHWGKMHTQGADTLAAVYPRWADFQTVRARLDPDGTFASPYLRRILG
ncbi:D-arabinono-1,4-lactone oxidase [soil metagenome]